MSRLVALALSLVFLSAPAYAGDHWSTLAASIAAEVSKAEALALGGNPDEAKTTVTQAYFGLFESEKMEAALRKEVGSKRAYEREKQFGDLRKLVAKGTPDEIRALSTALRSGLVEDGKVLDAAGVSPDVFTVNQ